MKTFGNWLSSGLVLLACLTHAERALAQLSQCAWPIEFSPEGYGNVVAPDEQARYWLVPFDVNYDTMKIEGAYPNARYFSFAVYNGDANGRPISVAGHKYDAILTPEARSQSSTAGSTEAAAADRTYELCVTRGADQCANTIGINDVAPYSNHAWVAMRIYAPGADKTLSGHVLMGGRPLPKITLLSSKGAQVLETCPLTQDAPSQPDPTTHYYQNRSVNRKKDLQAVFDMFFPESFDIYTPRDYYETAGDRLWFAAPKAPPIGLLPNPDNKYVAIVPGPHQPGRLIVIRGKAPTFPGAKHGPKPSQTPDMRYWSLCNNDFALPVPAIRCMTDTAAIIRNGYYTVVISDELSRPGWLHPDINWLPWGDEQYSKLIFFRNMIPVARNDTNYTKDEVPFPHAIQWVVRGCPDNCENKAAVIDFDLPYVPPRAAFSAAGPHVQRIMGEYYPIAVWCDQAIFEQGGWTACVGRDGESAAPVGVGTTRR